MKFSTRFKMILLIFLTSFFLISFFYTYSIYNPKSSLNFTGEKPRENLLFKKLVYISGEVQKPGVYEFQEGMRIIDIINIAGGFTEVADQNFVTSMLNMSEKLVDEQKIHIPQTKTTAEILGEASNESEATLIDINSASKAELDKLPGVGESTAQKIIDNRPYARIEDLLNVSGIGESKFEEIRNLITVN